MKYLNEVGSRSPEGLARSQTLIENRVGKMKNLLLHLVSMPSDPAQRMRLGIRLMGFPATSYSRLGSKSGFWVGIWAEIN